MFGVSMSIGGLVINSDIFSICQSNIEVFWGYFIPFYPERHTRTKIL